MGEGRARSAVLAVGLIILAAGCATGKKATTSGVEGAEVQEAAVYPLAGTPDASRLSEISFRDVKPDALGEVKVVGSKSGRHAGRLEAHSDGAGASFVLADPFVPGELVHVGAGVPLVGERNGSITFRVARSPGRLRAQETFPDNSTDRVPGTNDYLSRPDLHPPGVKVLKTSPDASPGYIFMAPKSGPGQNGPLILDGKGRIVWFHPLRTGFKSYDFRVAEYKGKPVLTWWQGSAPGAYGGGTGLIVDPSYRVIATVKGASGYPPDIHEFRVTPQGTALVLAYVPVRWSLSSIKGPARAAALDSIVLELDIKTGHVLFEWHSLGHVPLTESYAAYNPGVAIDYTHLNSVSLDRDGNFLVSARNTWTVYKVDRRSGEILWRLGGKQSTFRLPVTARFVGQHDFTRAPDGTYTLFDNGNILPPPKRASRGLVFAVDPAARAARIVRRLAQPHQLGTFSQGSVQPLASGHYVVGWGGGNPEVSEFGAAGQLLFDLRLVPKVDSYRSYRFQWSGRPQSRPTVKVITKKGHTVAYVSWNGATEVADWQVLAGASADSLDVVARAPRRGFETAIPLPGRAKVFAARAVSDAGKFLAASKTVTPQKS